MFLVAVIQASFVSCVFTNDSTSSLLFANWFPQGKLKNTFLALTCVDWLVGCHPAKRKVADMPGLWLDPWSSM